MLMLRVKTGDMQAFEQLVERNTARIHALVFRFLGDATLAEDLTQEAFLRIFKTARNYQPTAKFSTWLYRIVANLSFNVRRDRKKAMSLSLETIGDDETRRQDLPDPNSESPCHDLDDHELGEKLAQAVAMLPDNQRIGFILNRYEYKNYDEIAEILDCSTMAVKSLLSRARGNLRLAMMKYLT
jgi:RNA polymerase sigma-70 factor (ECF subfamily)